VSPWEYTELIDNIRGGPSEPRVPRSLDGKVAVITGAGRGLGRSHALTFAEAGADLVLLDLCGDDTDGYPYPTATRRQLEETAVQCRRHGPRVVTVAADVRAQAQIDRAIAQARAELPGIDILINNAGLLGPGGRRAHELGEAEWALSIDVNLNGVWRCAKAVLPHMIENGSGCIVNIASTAGLVGFELFSSYVAAKHGVIGLTKGLAVELGRTGVTFNCICPGPIRTGMTAGIPDEAKEKFARRRVPLRRYGEPEEVAQMTLSLVLPAASYLNGAVIPVDGGMLAQNT